MNATQNEISPMSDRRSRRRSLETMVSELVQPEPRKAYSAPQLTLLADYGEGGPEPVCLRD